MWGYGATRIRLIRAGTGIEWATLIPAAWVLSLLFLGALAPFFNGAAILLAANILLYGIAAAFIGLETIVHTRRPRDLLVLFMVPVMHISYGLAEWFEFFRPNCDLSENK